MTTSQNPTDNTATEQVWDEEYDVVVVGSGGGALTAAYTAGVEGLRTLVLEKTPLFGGVTTYAGAAIWFPGNQIEMEGDPGDSVDLAREYLSHLLDDSAKASHHRVRARARSLHQRTIERVAGLQRVGGDVARVGQRPPARHGGRDSNPRPPA